MKTCNKCTVSKPKLEFYKRQASKDGLQSYCKLCANEAVNKHMKTPEGKESTKRKVEKYRKTPQGKLVNRRALLKNRYSITLEEYNNMLESQDYICAICGTDKPGGMGRFHVDHNHITGKVRGLLCNNCNMLLGYYELGKNIDKWTKKYRNRIIKYLL